MLFNPKHARLAGIRLDHVAQRIQAAAAISPDLFFEVVAETCTLLPDPNKSGAAARINQLAAAGAWCDAALTLIEIERPAWKLRRAVHEDGKWHCSLSRQPNLPIELDDPVEASHEVLALAILSTLVTARQTESFPHGAGRGERIETAPNITADRPICCENFA